MGSYSIWKYVRECDCGFNDAQHIVGYNCNKYYVLCDGCFKKTKEYKSEKLAVKAWLNKECF
jgi:hypothetical protein